MKARLPIVLSLIFLSACGPSKRSDVARAVRAQQTAEKKVDYESSPDSAENIVENWKKNDSAEARQKICEALSELPSSELSLFVESIESSENEGLFKDCKSQLLEKMESHFAEMRASQTYSVDAKKNSGRALDFKLPFEVQERDLSNGYVAVTGDVKQGELVLTFDDGPHSRYTQVVLDTLKQVGVKAIFFQVGKNVDLYPEITRTVAAQGHAVGSHSYTHPCLGPEPACARANGGRNFSFLEGAAQIRRAHQSVFNALGFVYPYVRFPYGSSSKELKQLLKETQTAEFFWNIDSEDWRMLDKDGSPRTNAEVISSSLQQLDQRKRGVILFHDVHRRTAELLPEFLYQVYKRNYKIILIEPSDQNLKTHSPLLRSNLP